MFLKKERVIDKAYLEWIRQCSCLACGKWPSDPDHIKTVKTGGDDSKHNLWPLCRACHTTRHAKGIRWMAKEYIGCRRFLDSNGWTYDETIQRYIHTSDCEPDSGNSSNALQPMRITTEESAT